MKKQIVTFFGHKDTPKETEPTLRATLINLIEKHNAVNFYVGNNGNFDIMVRHVLEELSDVYPIEYSVVNIDVENIVPIWNKVSLTLDEAAMYSGIGKNTLRELSHGEGQCFTFFIGKNHGKRMIKRKEFDEFISKVHII